MELFFSVVKVEAKDYAFLGFFSRVVRCGSGCDTCESTGFCHIFEESALWANRYDQNLSSFAC